MNTPFTYEEAVEICEDFEDLQETELIIQLDIRVRCEVEHIAIVPFERKDIELYLETYTQTNDINASLATYAGKDYDVIIIARNLANKEELVIQTIREYIEAHGVQYNFPN